MKHTTVRSQTKYSVPSLAGFEGAVYCAYNFLAMTAGVGLCTRANTHTHTALHKYYATNFYCYTCTRGHFGQISASLWGSKRQSEKETSGLNLVSLFMCSSDDDSRVTTKVEEQRTHFVQVEISLHYGGTHIVLHGVTGLRVCACIHTYTITRSHPDSHMQHTSTLSWAHTVNTLSVTHTHTRMHAPLLIRIQFLPIPVSNIAHRW